MSVPEDAALFEEAVANLSQVIGLEPERREATQLCPDVDVVIDWAFIAAPELLGMLGGRERLEAVKDRLHPTTAALAVLGASLGIDAYLAARRRRVEFTDILRGVLGDGGVIVSPTMCGDAPPAGGPDQPGEDVELGLYDNAVAQNLTGLVRTPMAQGRGRSGRGRSGIGT